MFKLMLAIATLVLCGLVFLGIGVRAESLTFKAADGVVVHGDAVAAEGPARGVILLFHQAGSNHLEYAPIAPKLAKLGWTSLAIDQRSGGDLFGGHNQTVEQVGGVASFEAALPDLEAALVFARSRWPGQPIIAWGSSYSAALVFILAARHAGEIDGVMAFSPGEYLTGLSVAQAAAKVSVPVYVTSAADPAEERAAKDILQASPADIKLQFLPSHGAHGSSTLREDSDPAGYGQNWQSVEAFLIRLAAHSHPASR
jgi:alpha-beta hydrolase superfamily lysophospholipase